MILQVPTRGPFFQAAHVVFQVLDLFSLHGAMKVGKMMKLRVSAPESFPGGKNAWMVKFFLVFPWFQTASPIGIHGTMPTYKKNNSKTTWEMYNKQTL